MFLVQHFRGHNECFAHIHVGLGRRLYKELNVVLFLEFLAGLRGHLSLRLPVRLVSHENHDCVRLRLGPHFVAPVLQILETLHRGDTIGQQDGMGTSVENLGDTLEGLLAGGVPNLEFEY